MEADVSRGAGGHVSRVSVPFDEAVVHIGALVEQVVGGPVDPATNFFEAGLDSLAIVTVHALVCDTFACELAPTTLFMHPNVLALADLLSGGASQAPDAGIPQGPDAGAPHGAPTVGADLTRTHERRSRLVERRRDVRRGARRPRR